MKETDINKIFDSIESLEGHELLIIHNIERELEKRVAPHERNQLLDDQLFTEFNTYLSLCLKFNQESRIRRVFCELRDTLRDYEKNGNLIHKGSIYTNFAISCLKMNDIITAMHYFYKAEFEDRKLGNSTFDILSSPFFKENFWGIYSKILSEYLSNQNYSPYTKYFNNSPTNQNIDKLISFEKSVYNLQMLNIIIKFIQLCKRKLKNPDNTPIISSATSFYYLLGEMGMLFESIIKDHLSNNTDTFHKIITSQLTSTKIGNISLSICAIHNNPDLKITQNGGIVEYNSHLPNLLDALFSERETNKILALSIYILKSIRNNIVHNISDNSPLFANSELTLKCFFAQLIPFWINSYLE